LCCCSDWVQVNTHDGTKQALLLLCKNRTHFLAYAAMQVSNARSSSHMDVVIARNAGAFSGQQCLTFKA